MLTLISATPSPYARKNRIALIEKGIPFELKSEIPWHSTTETPKYNPLEKLPILIFDDGRAPIYESWYIQEYIVQKYRGKGPDLMPDSLDDQLQVRQIQVLADGACDAMSLVFFETGRGDSLSKEWLDRQLRKVNGVIKAMDELVQKMEGKFLVCDEFSVADIAAGAMLGMMDMVETKFGLIHWKEQYPELNKYWEMLESRESFRDAQPVMFELTEKVA
ncbi:glutathione S-transferase domain-containing protein [Hyaloscypha finlandica]|nr:glutathione S-transferase domain-containing protein [Hyaloscypha finlandica]